MPLITTNAWPPVSSRSDATLTYPPRHAAYVAAVPAGRMGTPQGVAYAVSFLASEAAGFITGQWILVDGGRGLTS